MDDLKDSLIGKGSLETQLQKKEEELKKEQEKIKKMQATLNDRNELTAMLQYQMEEQKGDAKKGDARRTARRRTTKAKWKSKVL